MFLKKIKFILIFIIISINLSALEKRESPIKLKTSVIIPCHYKHAHLLIEALNAYANQLHVCPDEVVISLSEVSKINSSIINNITTKNWPFKLVLIKNDSPVAPGENRNKACRIASGDLFICHDADDLPHVQRIEIIKYFFENYFLDHLMHAWAEANTQLDVYHDFNKIDWFQTINYEPKYGSGIYCSGPIAITRKVFENVKWNSFAKQGEDVNFNIEVYQKFKNKIIIKSPIYYYRYRLSSSRTK